MSVAIWLLFVAVVLILLNSFELSVRVMSFRLTHSFPQLKRLTHHKLTGSGTSQHRWLTLATGRATALRGAGRNFEVGACVLLKSGGSGTVSDFSKYGWYTVVLDGTEKEVSNASQTLVTTASHYRLYCNNSTYRLKGCGYRISCLRRLRQRYSTLHEHCALGCFFLLITTL